MAGFHGKIRCKGDFVSRGLNREVAVKLDEWFQSGMLESKNELIDKWLSFYQIAPIWRFYFSPGILDLNAWVGVWIPSIDKVGRRFPLILLAPYNETFSKLTDLAQLDDWLIQGEDLLLSTLENNLDFERFCSFVEEIQLPEKMKLGLDESKAKVDCSLPEFEQQQSIEQRLELLEIAVSEIAKHLNIETSITHQAVTTRKAADSYQKVYAELTFNVNLIHSSKLLETFSFQKDVTKFCVWTSDGNDLVSSQLVVSNGLPNKTQFAHFLKGFE